MGTAVGDGQPTSRSQLCKEARLARASAGVSKHPLPEQGKDHVSLKNIFLNKHINKDADISAHSSFKISCDLPCCM